jgi:septal ring factor EnvC (AmiA/AmiB activator)
VDVANLVTRVEILELKVEALEALPARVDALALQIAQHRDETRDGFSAIRAEIGAVDKGLRAEIGAVDDRLRAEIRAVDEGLRAEIRAVDDRLRAVDEGLRARMKVDNEALRAEIRAVDEGLRAEMKAGDEDSRTLTRVLHEDLVERIKWLGEGLGVSPYNVTTRRTTKRSRKPRRPR